MRIRLLFAATLLSLIAFPNVSVAQKGPSLDSAIESLRADTRADVVAIISETMQLNDQESKVFWPVYRKYQAEIVSVNDKRVAVIKSYAEKYTTMTDADAKSMIEQSLDFESSRIDVMKKYVKQFQEAGLSPLTVARFVQLAHRLDLVIDVVIAAELPTVLTKPAGQNATKQ